MLVVAVDKLVQLGSPLQGRVVDLVEQRGRLGEHRGLFLVMVPFGHLVGEGMGSQHQQHQGWDHKKLVEAEQCLHLH